MESKRKKVKIAIFLLILSLIFSCGDNQEKARKKLVQMGVSYSEESFIKCIKENDILAIKLFLAAGMNPNVKDLKGKAVLNIAYEKKYADVIEILLNAGATGTCELLAEAIGDNQLKIIESLLKTGTNVNCKIGEKEILRKKEGKELLYAFFDINIIKDFTLLMYAASLGKSEVVKILLDAGANINEVTVGGLTPLMIATAFNYVEVVKILLNANANMNIKNSWGDTALSIAKRNGNDEIINLLKK